MQIKSAKDLTVYKRAYELAMEIFHASKHFPAEERYSLTDQLRRSSRSVCSNLREAWAKRRYEAHFVSKLTDSDGEMVKLKPGSISPVIAGIRRNAIMHSSRSNAVRSERCSEALSRTRLLSFRNHDLLTADIPWSGRLPADF